MEKEELEKRKKELDKKLHNLELCPRCYHYICLKDGKCPHCGLVKKGDEWIMTKEAFKQTEIEEEKEKKKEEEKSWGNVFGDILTFDEEEDEKKEKK